MRSKLLFAAIGNIDDMFISEDAEAFAAADRAKLSKPFLRNRTVLRFAGLAACAAAVLFCIWALPGLFNSPHPIIDNPGVVSSNPPAGQGYITPAPGEIWPLTFNKVGSQFAASIYIEGHFWYELTEEQKNALFPDLPLPLAATANYRGDGSLYNIIAYEVDAGGNRALFKEAYTAVMIEVSGADGGSMEDVIYEYEPVTTNIWGVPVVAGVFDFKKKDGVALYIAKFTIGETTYYIKIHEDDVGDSGKDKLSLIVNKIIKYQEVNGAADLSILNDPVIPELRNERLTFEAARKDPDFGAYVPAGVPSGFSFESALRFIDQERNNLSLFWDTGYDYINWNVSKATAYDLSLIVAASELEKYDMSLYPIPLAESVPKELWDYVNNPVFLAQEFTLDVIKARAYYVNNDRGDNPGWRMDFSVLYGDVVVRVNIKGASPEQVWEMIKLL